MAAGKTSVHQTRHPRIAPGTAKNPEAAGFSDCSMRVGVSVFNSMLTSLQKRNDEQPKMTSQSTLSGSARVPAGATMFSSSAACTLWCVGLMGNRLSNDISDIN